MIFGYQAGVLVQMELLSIFGEDGIESGPDAIIAKGFGVLFHGIDFAGGVGAVVVFIFLSGGSNVDQHFEPGELSRLDSETFGEFVAVGHLLFPFEGVMSLKRVSRERGISG